MIHNLKIIHTRSLLNYEKFKPVYLFCKSDGSFDVVVVKQIVKIWRRKNAFKHFLVLENYTYYPWFVVKNELKKR